MNISDHFCRELAQAAYEIIHEGRFANSTVQKKFRAHPHWVADEKSLFAESLYFILRNWRRLCSVLSADAATASHDTALNAVRATLMLHSISVPRSLRQEFRLDPVSLERSWTNAGSVRAIAYSYPDWLDELGSAVLGSGWDAMVYALHAEPKVVLRVNTLRISRDELEGRLKAAGIQSHQSGVSDAALVLTEHANVFALKEFRDGLFEVQDAGSQCIAPFCDVKPGMRVIDACAGSGGKSLHLAALMENKGRVIAMDTEEWKLTALAQRARRDGISIIETRTITSTKVVKRLRESAQRVLLDVPCSGLGVLRRNPDTKWHLQASDIERFVKIQRDILSQYSSMVSADGKLIYATCSILPAESEEQVRWFLESFAGWTLEAEQRIDPRQHEADGFYMARLHRTGS